VASLAPCWLHTPMLAWFAAFKARNVLVFFPLLSKTGARRSYLLQTTKVNLLAHAKSVTPLAAIFRWSSESGNEVTKTIRKRFIELGGSPTARKTQFEGSNTLERGFSSVCHILCSKEEATLYAAQLLKFAHPPNLRGRTLGDHEWYSPWLQARKATSAGFRL
jgi:hypothetical protein